MREQGTKDFHSFRGESEVMTVTMVFLGGWHKTTESPPQRPGSLPNLPGPDHCGRANYQQRLQGDQ